MLNILEILTKLVFSMSLQNSLLMKRDVLVLFDKSNCNYQMESLSLEQEDLTSDLYIFIREK